MSFFRRDVDRGDGDRGRNSSPAREARLVDGPGVAPSRNPAGTRMTADMRLDSDEWDRLEALWEKVFALPPSERLQYIQSLDVSDELRAELNALTARSSAAEAFFDRFQA